MRRSSLATAVVGVGLIGFCLLGTVGIGRSIAPKAEDDFQLVKVAEGVYAGIARPGGLASGNAGFIVGDGGVLIVDTFFTPVAITPAAIKSLLRATCLSSLTIA